MHSCNISTLTYGCCNYTVQGEGMRARFLAFAIFGLSSTSALGDCTNNMFGICQENWDNPVAKEWQTAVDKAREVGLSIKPMDAIKFAFPLAEPMLKAVGASGVPYLNSAAQNMAAIGTKLDKETQTAISNALTNPTKGIRDAAQTALKASNDTIDAAAAAARYGERTISGTGEIFSDAEVRLREGKVVDAVWHLGTDRMRLENDNAAKLMQESEVARQIAKQAAAFYGGPAGAAAFAAWYTYNATKGDVEKALLSGVYAYAVTSGNAEVGKMPTGTVSEVVKKAAAVAAVRGLAVGAAGGTQQEILDAIAQSGGAVIIQSGQSYVTKKVIEPAKAKADAFCMDQLDQSCGDAMQWVDDTKKQVETYQKIASGTPSVVVTGDGQWAVSWNKQALVNRSGKAPGVALTYIGQGSLYRQQVLDLKKIGISGIPKVVIQPKEEKTPVKTIVVPPPPPTPKTYSVTFASNGLWIDDRRFPMGRSYTNKIEFEIDGKHQDLMYLHDGMDSFTADLQAGTHVFTYKVRVRSSEGGRIEQDCAIKFTVSGVELYNPSIRFARVDERRGTVSECRLIRQ